LEKNIYNCEFTFESKVSLGYERLRGLPVKVLPSGKPCGSPTKVDNSTITHSGT
jgi:hypothetical protein